MLVVLGLPVSFASPLTKDQGPVMTAGIVRAAGGFIRRWYTVGSKRFT